MFAETGHFTRRCCFVLILGLSRRRADGCTLKNHLVVFILAVCRLPGTDRFALWGSTRSTLCLSFSRGVIFPRRCPPTVLAQGLLVNSESHRFRGIVEVILRTTERTPKRPFARLRRHLLRKVNFEKFMLSPGSLAVHLRSEIDLNT
uniref:Secreted protein n=1 Tax=Steinernema glaseri TaxID=37863 RepID=A0A1I8AKL3_9BILA